MSLKTADGNTLAVTDGDPEGAREAQNIVNMAPDTTVITVMNPTMFYDDGGKDNPVTVKFKGVTIFKPGKENCAIKIEPIKFSTGSGKFYIYNGEGVNADNLVGSYNYVGAPPTYISKAADGALTIKFDGPTSTYTKYDGLKCKFTPRTHSIRGRWHRGFRSTHRRRDPRRKQRSNAEDCCERGWRPWHTQAQQHHIQG